MARTPSTSDLCHAEANKAYDKLAIISENIDKLNELANYIFDLKDWLKFSIGNYLNDYIIELETKCNELLSRYSELESIITENKEELLNIIDSLSSEVASLENQVNGLFLKVFDDTNDDKGATCKAISDFIDNKLQNSFLPQIQKLLMPSGSIIIWSGLESNIPSGWLLCDGNNGTPDLRGRFVLGCDNSHLQGSKGGSKTVMLTAHYHYWGHHSGDNSGYFLGTGDDMVSSKEPSIPGKTIYAAYYNGNNGGGRKDNLANKRASAGGENLITSLNYTNNTDSASVENTGEQLPPYYSLCYIMKA